MWNRSSPTQTSVGASAWIKFRGSDLLRAVEPVDTPIDEPFPHGADDAESLLGHRLSGDFRSAKACRLREACAAGDRAVWRTLSRARHGALTRPGRKSASSSRNSRASRRLSPPMQAPPTRRRSRRSAMARCVTSASSRRWTNSMVVRGPCAAHFSVCFWHKADKSSLLLFVRFRG